MEDLDDEALQNLIEKQVRNQMLPPAGLESTDKELYSLVFSELRDYAKPNIHGSIADKVVAKILENEEKANRVNYGLIIFAIVVLICGMVYAALTLTNNMFLTSAVKIISSHNAICTFIILVFCMIQGIDKYVNKKYKIGLTRI